VKVDNTFWEDALKEVFASGDAAWPELVIALGRLNLHHSVLVGILRDPRAMSHSKWPHVIDALLETQSWPMQRAIAESLLARPEVIAHERWPHWIDMLVDNPSHYEWLGEVLAWKVAGRPELRRWIPIMLSHGMYEWALIRALENKANQQFPEWRDWAKTVVQSGQVGCEHLLTL
jgi:hypothetical protein